MRDFSYVSEDGCMVRGRAFPFSRLQQLPLLRLMWSILQ